MRLLVYGAMVLMFTGCGTTPTDVAVTYYTNPEGAILTEKGSPTQYGLTPGRL